MENTELVFAHPSQLNAIYALPFYRKNGVETLLLEGTITNHPERVRWETELNRHYHACGCDTGAKGLVASALAGGAWAGYSCSKGICSTAVAITVAVLIAIVGAITGKIFGQMRADGRLKQTIREIQSRWPDEHKTGDW